MADETVFFVDAAVRAESQSKHKDVQNSIRNVGRLRRLLDEKNPGKYLSYYHSHLLRGGSVLKNTGAYRRCVSREGCGRCADG